MSSWHLVLVGYIAGVFTIAACWAVPRLVQWAWWRWWVLPHIPKREPLRHVAETLRAPGVRRELVFRDSWPKDSNEPLVVDLATWNGPVVREDGADFYAKDRGDG